MQTLDYGSEWCRAGGGKFPQNKKWAGTRQSWQDSWCTGRSGLVRNHKIARLNNSLSCPQHLLPRGRLNNLAESERLSLESFIPSRLIRGWELGLVMIRQVRGKQKAMPSSTPKQKGKGMMGKEEEKSFHVNMAYKSCFSVFHPSNRLLFWRVSLMWPLLHLFFSNLRLLYISL